jgi:superfamily II DNA/RNA helicase
MKTFKDLGVSEDILLAIEKKGYEKPSAIQEKVIPLFLH